MKKIIILIFVMLLAVPIQAFAVATPKHTVKYYSNRDEYVVTYNRGFSRPPVKIKLSFDSPSGTHAEKEFDANGNITGVFYLTCNGTYTLDFSDSAGLVGQITGMVTTQIQSNRCESYPYSIKNDLNAQVHKTGSPEITSITWRASQGPIAYSIYKDGEHVETIWNDGLHNMVHYPNGPGVYTIVPNGGGSEVSDVLITEKMLQQGGAANNPWGSGQSTDINGGGLLPGETGGGGTDPGGGGTNPPSCNGCTTIQQMLACPEWDEYMAEWGKVIKANVPPAPDWQQVANVMRDTIVPAIGQELLNKMPQYAKIIGDDLASREKPVAAPPPLPTFTPPTPIPTMTDMPNKVEMDMTQNVPSFEPDFSGSKPFIIPDPMDAKLPDKDRAEGYTKQPTNMTPTDYQKTMPVVDDIGYEDQVEGVEITAPAYEIKNQTATKPPPTYKNTSPVTQEPNKTYKTVDNPMPDYTTTNEQIGSPMPEWKGRGG